MMSRLDGQSSYLKIDVKFIFYMKEQQHFVYIDSSEEESQLQLQHPKFDSNQYSQNQPPETNKLTSCHGFPYQKQCKSQYCMMGNPEQQLITDDEYHKKLLQIINHKINNQAIKKMIAQIEDKELVDNIDKRNIQYKYLMERIEVDQRYRRIQQQKVSKLKQQNLRKKGIHQRKKKEQLMKTEGCQLKKYAVVKREKREKVVKHVQKEKEKLQIERIILTDQHIKEKLKQKREKDNNKMQSYLNKQRNQIEKLRNQFEQAKQQKRINQLEQKKVLSSLKNKIEQQKQVLGVRLTKNKQFKV